MYTFKKTVCILLSTLLISLMIPSQALAYSSKTPDDFVPGSFSIENIPMRSFKALNEEGTFTTPRNAGNTEYPTSYNSADKGYITSVKNQGMYGTCWAHGTAASAEASLIKNNGYKSTLDISEYHLAYFQNGEAYDPLNMLKGDKTYSGTTSSTLDMGGSNLCTPFMLARWTGVVDEIKHPEFAYSKASNYSSTAKSNAYKLDFAHLEDSVWVACVDINDMKYMIMEYGAGTVGYYNSDNYFSSTNKAYFYNGTLPGNHEVTVVGWDDNFDRTKFKENCRPKNNGAWLIKNSWGSVWGNNGYFWLSYEDTSLCDGYAAFYSFGKSDNYDNNYQYDGSGYFNFEQNTHGAYYANVFTADSSEDLKAIGFWTCQNDVDYSIQIYKNLSNALCPDSATPCLAQPIYGNEIYPGYHTIELAQSIELPKGTKYAVVINLTCNSEDTTDYLIDKTDKSSSWLKVENTTAAGQSFYKPNPEHSWIDKSSFGINYRIKAFTDEAEKEYEQPDLPYLPDTETDISDATTDTATGTTTDTSTPPIIDTDTQPSFINYEKITDTSSLRAGDRIVLLDENKHIAILPQYTDGTVNTLAAQMNVTQASQLGSNALWELSSVGFGMFILESPSGAQLTSIDLDEAYLNIIGSAILFKAAGNDTFTLSAESCMTTRYLSYNENWNGFRFFKQAESASKFSIYRACNPGVSFSPAIKETGALVDVTNISELKDGDKIVLYSKIHSLTVTTQLIGANLNTLSACENLVNASEADDLSIWTVVKDRQDNIYLSDTNGNKITALDDNAVRLTKNGSPLNFNQQKDGSFVISSSARLEQDRYLKFNRSIGGYRFYTNEDSSAKLFIYKYEQAPSNDFGIHRGDINADGKITMFDIVLIQRLICALIEGNELTLEAADIDKNNDINMSDVVLLQKYIAGYKID